MNHLKVTIQLLIIITIGISLMFVTERQEIVKKRAEAEVIAKQLELEKIAKIAKAAAAKSPYRDKVEEAIATADIATLSNEEINNVPRAEIFEFEDSAKVSFSKQGLTAIDEGALKPYRNYKLLDLSNNALQKLPSYLSKMDYLEVLVLDNNQLTELPYFLQNCKRLKIIYVNNNPIKKISCNLQKMPVVSFIELQNTQFSRLPKFPDRVNLSIVLTAKDYGQIKRETLYEYTGKRYKYTYFEFL
jgi:hypothetical protein